MEQLKTDRYIVRRDCRIIDAMDTIDQSGKGIAFVLNEDLSLFGTITDGDIRRHILKKRSLTDPVERAANQNFLYVTEDTAEEHAAVMRENGVTAVPLIDSKKRLVSVYFSDEEILLVDRKKLDVPVVIMAGGKGTRLYPFTKVLPKPLIPVKGIPITMHIMNRFASFGVSEFLMIVNHQKELIKAYYSDPNLPYRIRFAEEAKPLGTAGGLKMLQGAYDRSFFMTNCDILVKCDYDDLYIFHEERKNHITVVCAVKKEVIPYGTIVLDDKGYLKSIVEKPEHTYLINTGFYVINPQALELVSENEKLTMPELIDRCKNSGLNVGVYPVSENHWSDMGTLDLLKKMEDESL